MLSHFSHVRLCDPMGYSLPGSSVHGLLQARILERVAIPCSGRSSWPRDQTEALYHLYWQSGPSPVPPPGTPNGQVSFHKGARQFSGKGTVLSQKVLGQLYIHIQKNQVGLLPNTLYKQKNSRKIWNLNIRTKTIKLLKGNIGMNLCDVEWEKSF